MDIENSRLSEDRPGAGENAASGSDLPHPGGHRRNAVRRIFREMIKEELAAGPLPARTRRELVEFASTAGLDVYEARVTIRAVEFELGMATDLSADPADLESVPFLSPVTWFLLRFLLAAASGVVLAWFVGRARGTL